MDTKPFQFAGHRETVFNIESSPESVAHIGFHQYAHIVSCGFKHFVDTYPHEVHASLERSSELIAPPVGVRGEELRDKVTVAGVHFHAVETGVTCCPHSVAEQARQFADLILAQGAHQSGRVEVEASACSHRSPSGSRAVGHVAAVADLDRGLGAGSMDAVGDFTQRGHDLRPEP